MRIDRIDGQSANLYRAARLAALRDAPEAFCSTYERERLLSEEDWLQRAHSLDGKDRVGFLALEGGSPFGLVLAFRDQAKADLAEILSMYVSAAHRRVGVGTELLEAIRMWATEAGIPELRLQVMTNNARAIAFYKRNGFIQTDAAGVAASLGESSVVEMAHSIGVQGQ